MTASFQNLFVAKLPRNVGDAELMNIFRDFSPRSAKVMLDASTGRSKGFGFVLFPTAAHGASAYNALNRQLVALCGHRFVIVVSPSTHNGEAAVEESVALFIRNMPGSMSHDDIDALLARYGTLVFTAIRPDHLGGRGWVVYAEYDSVGSSKLALQKLHGCHYWEEEVHAPVLAKFAESETVKRERAKAREHHVAPVDRCISVNSPFLAPSLASVSSKSPSIISSSSASAVCWTFNPYSVTSPVRYVASYSCSSFASDSAVSTPTTS